MRFAAFSCQGQAKYSRSNLLFVYFTAEKDHRKYEDKTTQVFSVGCNKPLMNPRYGLTQ